MKFDIKVSSKRADITKSYIIPETQRETNKQTEEKQSVSRRELKY